MQKAQVGDYLFIKYQNEKDEEQTGIVLVKKVNDTSLDCIIPEYNHLFDTSNNYELSGNNAIKIIANLGNEPKVKHINGNRVFGSIGFKKHEHLGKIHFFFKPSKSTIKNLFPLLDAMYSQACNKGFDAVFSLLAFEVYNDKKLTGHKSVQYYRNKELNLKVIRIYIDDELAPDTEEYVNALLKAVAVAISESILALEYNASRWAADFCKLSHVELVNKDSVDALIQNFLSENSTGTSLSQYIRSLPNDRDEDPITDRDIFKLHAKTAAKLYKLTVKDLDNISKDAAQMDLLKTIIEANTLEFLGLLKSCFAYLEPYTKNLKTFVAGAYYLYLTDSKMPESIKNRCKKLSSIDTTA